MYAHKAIAAAILWFPWVATPPSFGSDPTPAVEPAIPVIAENHRAHLSRIARRALKDVWRSDRPYEPGYVPQALASLYAESVVRLRDHGYLLATGVGEAGPIAESVRDAAVAAGQFLRNRDEVHPAVIERCLVEIEVIGPPAALPPGTDWTQPGALDSLLDPGLDGLLVMEPSRARRLCPSELITTDLSLSQAMTLLAQGMRLRPDQVTQIPLMRFRTAFWYEPADGGSIVSLRRGMTLVSHESIQPRFLDAIIDGIAEYMVYRQQASGLFSYQFDPGADRYSDEDNTVRQVGAASALCVYSAYSRKSASHAAAHAAIRHHLQRLTPIASLENAAFIATDDGRNKLGVTALLSIAIAHHPDSTEYAAQRDQFINAILFLQRPSGMFMTAFPPAVEVSGQDYFPGEALLALALEYDRQPSGRILEAFDRAIGFYRDYFQSSRSPAFVPWQVQAFSMMARQTKRKDYVDYVFGLTDWLAAKQLTSSNCKWPELYGGVAANTEGRVGAATAAYLEAFSDALTLARTLGDEERVRRYDALVRQAARFVVQLQFRAEEAYFVRSPQDAVGGIRTAADLNHLRIDHCQHALVGLVKARRALFPDER